MAGWKPALGHGRSRAWGRSASGISNTPPRVWNHCPAQHSRPHPIACWHCPDSSAMPGLGLTVPHQLLDLPASLPGWREDEVWIDGEEIEGSFLSRSVPGLRQLVTDSQCPPHPPPRPALPSPSPNATVEWRRRGPRARISAPTASSEAAAASTPLASFFMHLYIHSIVFIVH